MTITHEHYIAAGNILPKIRDQITVPSPLDLTDATLKLRYSKPGSAVVERDATLVSVDTGTEDEATVFTLEWAPTTADTATEGVYNYQWRVTPEGETAPIDLPLEVDPEADGTERKFLRFEVTEALPE